MRPIKWSACNGAASFNHTRKGHDWEAFCRVVTQVTQCSPDLDREAAKLKLEAFIPAVWVEGVNHKQAQGISHFDVIGLDIDNSYTLFNGLNPNGTYASIKLPSENPLRLEELLKRLQSAGLTGVGYESFSSTDEYPRYRLFLLASRSYTEKELPAVVEIAMQKLGLWDYPEAVDISTSRSVPRIFFGAGTQTERQPKTFRTEGGMLELAADISIPVPGKPAPRITPEALALKEAWDLEHPNKESNEDWYWDWPINFPTLRIHELVEAMGLEPESPTPYQGDLKARCHCKWHEEHTDGKNDTGATIFWGEDRWPEVRCSHSIHVDKSWLQRLVEEAGLELVKQFAEPLDIQRPADFSDVQGGDLGYLLDNGTQLAPKVTFGPLVAPPPVQAATAAPAPPVQAATAAPAPPVPQRPDYVDPSDIDLSKFNPEQPIHVGTLAARRMQIKSELYSKIIKKQEIILPNTPNIVKIFMHDPELKGRLQLNEMSQSVMWSGKDEEGDIFRIDTQCWLMEKYDLDIAGKDKITDAIRKVAEANPIHPLRDKLDTFKWDGVDRISVLMDALGIEQVELHRQQWERWMVGAVQRVYNPGCQMDYSIVLVGPEGVGKTSVFEVLAMGFFSDSKLNLKSKDAMQALQKQWIYCMPEMDEVMQNASRDDVRAFMSGRRDHFRAPYAREPKSYPRTVVFAGCINPNEFIEDPEGDRRFWVQKCSVTKDVLKETMIGEVRPIVEALWAQAVANFRNGMKPMLEQVQENERKVANEQFHVVTPGQELLAQHMYTFAVMFSTNEADVNDVNLEPSRDGFSLLNILNICDLDGKVLDPKNMKVARQLGSQLRKLGWEKRHTSLGNRWFIPEGLVVDILERQKRMELGVPAPQPAAIKAPPIPKLPPG